MENIDETITNITYSINEKKLTIVYGNSAVETIILNKTNYIAIFDKWFIETPVFITDKFKAQIKSLNFVKINKDEERNINELDNFFSDTDKASKFFNYARTRKNLIDVEKLKWSSTN
jgi:hypothetical protein